MKHRLTSILTAAALLAVPFSCTTTPTCAAPPAKEARATHTPKHGYALGYVPDPHFPKGVLTFETSPWANTAAVSVDLSNQMAPDDAQGPVGECTGHGLAREMAACSKRVTGKFTLFSPKFIYFNERVNLGTVNQDSGARIGADGITTLQSLGACLLTNWPMTSDWRKKPCQACYTEAKKHLVLKAYKVDNRHGQDLEKALAAGFPVVYGIVLHEEFEDLNATNHVYHGRGAVIGGHCMVMYKDNLTQTSTTDGLAPGQVRSHNQWADAWGLHDTFDMSLSIAHSSAVDDCYVIYAEMQ